MRRIYCISGLAADHRLFQQLTIPNCELVPVPWCAYAPDDTMATYAAKMAANIHEADAVVIGLSFGGMLAVEMAKVHAGWRVFLVSSAKVMPELGRPGGLVMWLLKKGLVPAFIFNKPNSILLNRMGAKTDAEKALISQIIKDSDPQLMKWSLQRIVSWNNYTYPPNITHLHGTDDHIISAAHVKPDHWINGGTHIMIYNHADEVSKIISESLRQ